jgi:quercetin 2,3-dioxygenase
MTDLRPVTRVIPGQPASDGAGVRLLRSLGASPGLRLDPFLMLDEFYSDDPADYLAGFPPHPHRGFETVTYMLDGHMRHRDHLGNTGDLGPGGVQWMTAGRGIIHEEMPQQTAGRMRGFQLWLNLPAADKLQAARYRDIPAAAIPERSADGVRLRLIAGQVEQTRGAVDQLMGTPATQPLYADLHLDAGARHTLPLPVGHSAFVYLYEGAAHSQDTPLRARAVSVLGEGAAVSLQADAAGARLLVLAARPLREPVVQYGPFVMNTREEIEQALADYQAGTLAG